MWSIWMCEIRIYVYFSKWLAICLSLLIKWLIFSLLIWNVKFANIYFSFIDYTKALTVWITTNCGKLFYFILFYFTLQYCTGFAIHWHESATHVHEFPILNPPPTTLPISFLWVITVHQPQASCILYWTQTSDSFLTWYFTCFNAILPNHPTLSLSHRVQKSVLYICVSFAVSHTGLVQLSHPYMTSGKTMALTRWTFVGKVMSLLFNMK